MLYFARWIAGALGEFYRVVIELETLGFTPVLRTKTGKYRPGVAFSAGQKRLYRLILAVESKWAAR
jgi:hypothetical protein